MGETQAAIFTAINKTITIVTYLFTFLRSGVMIYSSGCMNMHILQ